MIALIQRVTEARVVVEGETVGAIGPGLLALIGIEREDAEANATRMIERLLGYRVFQDDADRMNRSLRDVAGGLLLVPQFTLAADTRKGRRPSFSGAAGPAHGAQLFGYLQQQAGSRVGRLASGSFGADMQVSLVNDGPVTFWLDA